MFGSFYSSARSFAAVSADGIFLEYALECARVRGALLGKLSAIISFQKRRFIGAKKVLKRAFMYVSIGEV